MRYTTANNHRRTHIWRRLINIITITIIIGIIIIGIRFPQRTIGSSSHHHRGCWASMVSGRHSRGRGSRYFPSCIHRNIIINIIKIVGHIHSSCSCCFRSSWQHFARLLSGGAYSSLHLLRRFCIGDTAAAVGVIIIITITTRGLMLLLGWCYPSRWGVAEISEVHRGHWLQHLPYIHSRSRMDMLSCHHILVDIVHYRIVNNVITIIIVIIMTIIIIIIGSVSNVASIAKIIISTTGVAF
mmetsp:Transcript_25847/g.43392  ORF Transcript_25847/g.43392 Transcript_25847/m.43392 type:complete len:241 (+) Transcript_25847:861-1583(+)